MYDCSEFGLYSGQPVNKKLLVLGKSAASEFTYSKPWACISIGTEVGDWPKINKCQLVDLLQVAFYDLDKMPSEQFLNSHDKSKIVLFSENHAQQIWKFVESVWDKVDSLMVHCLAGACRSPAVAAAIAKIKYGDDQFYFDNYMPNMLVFRTMLACATKGE